MIRPALAAIALGGSLCVAGVPALAQAPITRGATSTEIAERINSLISETAQLQRDMATLRQDNGRLRLDSRDLQSQLSASTGKIEQLEFRLAQAQDEIERLQADNSEIGAQLRAINGQLNALQSVLGHSGSLSDPTSPGLASQAIVPSETDTGTAPPGIDQYVGRTGGPVDLTPGAPVTPETQTRTVSATPTQSDVPEINLPSDPQALFDFGKNRLVQFDYAGAEAAFGAFLRGHENHERASEAQYWLGEVQYQLGNYAASGATYTSMIRKYPEDPRAADALVKLARSLRLTGETEKACAALGAIESRYPNASAVTRNLANLERDKAQCGA